MINTCLFLLVSALTAAASDSSVVEITGDAARKIYDRMSAVGATATFGEVVKTGANIRCARFGIDATKGFRYKCFATVGAKGDLTPPGAK